MIRVQKTDALLPLNTVQKRWSVMHIRIAWQLLVMFCANSFLLVTLSGNTEDAVTNDVVQ